MFVSRAERPRWRWTCHFPRRTLIVVLLVNCNRFCSKERQILKEPVTSRSFRRKQLLISKTWQFQWVERPMTRTKLQVRRVWYFVIIMREIYMRFCINVLCPSVSVSLLILLNDESIIWEKPPNISLYFAASMCTKAQSIHRKWLIWKENFGNRTLGDSNHCEIPWFCE